MRRDRGEAGCGAGYAVLICCPSSVAWAELCEAAYNSPCSVLLYLFGKFIFGVLAVLHPPAFVPPLVSIVDPTLRYVYM